MLIGLSDGNVVIATIADYVILLAFFLMIVSL